MSEKLILNPYWQFLSHLGRSHCEGKTVLMHLLGYGEDPPTDICNHSGVKTPTIAIPRGEKKILHTGNHYWCLTLVLLLSHSKYIHFVKNLAKKIKH